VDGAHDCGCFSLRFASGTKGIFRKTVLSVAQRRGKPLHDQLNNHCGLLPRVLLMRNEASGGAPIQRWFFVGETSERSE
jgi:hypothetical protein